MLLEKAINVLVFPGGNENGLEIYKSLKNCKEINLFSVSSNVKNHASFCFNNHFIIDDIYSDNWISQLNQIIFNNQIDYIYPALDFVSDKLIDKRNEILTKIVLPEKEDYKIIRSKRNTYKFFKDIIPTPKVYFTIDEVEKFPVFIKPDQGYGSQGTDIIESRELLKFKLLESKEDMLISEYLDGEEYTIDCFSNSENKLLFSSGRTRERIRMGTSMHSENVSDDSNVFFYEIAKKILSRLKLTGAWFFQMKCNKEGSLKLLEIGYRIAGTMAFNRVKGINFPLLTIFELSGIPTDVLVNNNNIIIDRALTNRYSIDLFYSTVYIDLDDTVIIKDKLNLDIIKYLYQCVNKGKKIILMTKNNADSVFNYLEEKKIRQIFDEIIWLKESDKKSNYIIEKNCIFIDDSFSQRKDVAEKLKIATFDPSMIEVLIDDRI